MTTKRMTFHESYGDLTVSLLRAIKRYNVSPSDYQSLESQYGQDYDRIEADIKVFSASNGSFNEYRWRQDIGAAW